MNADITPAIACCFFCGASKRRMTLIKGKMDSSSFPRVCVDYDPCEGCLEEMQGKIVMFEVGPENPSRMTPKVVDGIHLTGRFLCVTAQALLASSIKAEVVDRIVEAKVAYLEGPHFEQFLPKDQQAEKEE